MNYETRGETLKKIDFYLPELICPQDVFPMEVICEYLPGDKIAWLEDLFEAISYGDKIRINRMMEGLKV